MALKLKGMTDIKIDSYSYWLVQSMWGLKKVYSTVLTCEAWEKKTPIDKSCLLTWDSAS